MSDGCVYDEPYRGRCGKEAVRTDPELCDNHAEKTCWCGKPAVEGCVAASSLVCGQPLCEEHECHRKGITGGTGAGPHSKKGRQQYEEWSDE